MRTLDCDEGSYREMLSVCLDACLLIISFVIYKCVMIVYGPDDVVNLIIISLFVYFCLSIAFCNFHLIVCRLSLAIDTTSTGRMPLSKSSYERLNLLYTYINYI